MTDLRKTEIEKLLADNISRSRYAIDLVTQRDGPIARGDKYQVGTLASLTVVADGNVSTSPQSASLSALELTVDRHPAIFLDLPKVADWQLLDGSTKDQFGKNAAKRLKSYADDEFCQYLAYSLGWVTGAVGAGDVYHRNVAGDTVAASDFANAIADLKVIDGVDPSNIITLLSPYAEASLISVGGLAPTQNTGLMEGQFGVKRVGRIHDTDAYVCNSIPRNKTVATTAAVTTGTGVTHTYTVAAGHGLVPGMLATVAGHDADENIATATAITSTTATTVVITTAATADGTSSDAIGLITTATSWNMVLDISDIYAAQVILPEVEVVKLTDKTGWVLQCSSLWGRIGRAGKVRVVHTPGTSA